MCALCGNIGKSVVRSTVDLPTENPPNDFKRNGGGSGKHCQGKLHVSNSHHCTCAL